MEFDQTLNVGVLFIGLGVLFLGLGAFFKGLAQFVQMDRDSAKTGLFGKKK